MKERPVHMYEVITVRGTATGGRGEEEETHIYEPTGDELRQGGPTYEVVQADWEIKSTEYEQTFCKYNVLICKKYFKFV